MTINYLKMISCFDIDEYKNNPIEIIKFEANDNLDWCGRESCQYGTLSAEIAGTILNTPWGKAPFRFDMKVLRSKDKGSVPGALVQIIPVGGEWRRRYFGSCEKWGPWVNIAHTIDFIRNADENVRDYIIEKWNRWKIIKEGLFFGKKWKKYLTIDETLEKIRMGTVRIYRSQHTGNIFIE
jgi:hypothetical protein